jgi:hypothetical protein
MEKMHHNCKLVALDTYLQGNKVSINMIFHNENTMKYKFFF